jgi:dTDP-4-dehydrorhamnose 3,5-epimerase
MERRVKVTLTAIQGVLVAETHGFTDQRGAFARFFCESELTDVMGERRIVQINHSHTASRGAVRGIHYQHPPHAEMKLVRCIRGRIWDVAVDLRSGSPTFLEWHAEELTLDNARMLIIPEGCAHGFQVLEPDSQLLYLHTAFYVPEAEDGVAYDDPRLAIAWPLPITDLSARDRQHPPISPTFSGIRL